MPLVITQALNMLMPVIPRQAQLSSSSSRIGQQFTIDKLLKRHTDAVGAAAKAMLMLLLELQVVNVIVVITIVTIDSPHTITCYTECDPDALQEQALRMLDGEELIAYRFAGPVL